MKRIGNSNLRALYVYEHPDKTVYVGLTYNYKERHASHMRKHKILIEKNKLGGQVYKKLGIFYPKDIAAIKEDELIEEYRAKGWTLLNIKKGGSLGSNILFWKEQECIESAKKCNTRTEWKLKYKGAYASAKQNGWFEKCIVHMGNPVNGVKKEIICIETNEVFESLHSAAHKFSLSVENLCNVLKGKKKSFGGYTFKYASKT